MDECSSSGAPEAPFKKPLLVGKIGKFPKRMQKPAAAPEPEEEKPPLEIPTPVPQDSKTDETTKGVAYEEPPWSGLPDPSRAKYHLEVLKNGSIIETVSLMEKPFWVFGRLPVCDICMQHPTISRHHAVLQYRIEGSGSSSPGFYIYDLESTHGTFLNKNRIRPRSYVKMHVGHMLKLGCSTRAYILNGPPEDAEPESDLSITELKQKRAQELSERHRKAEEMKRKEEERGVDWGMGEDADEETDLSENPFAQTNNEDLYIDNPKKALRGFFEREGLELEYDCTEQGIGQFLCKVELPLDDEMGRPIIAEAIHKGKKKEAVVQCALEACRILDRHGVLRQAQHESKRRKPKNWEENDYYDSDDDTFLDRTGTVEKKREKRMNAKAPQKADTYETLVRKEKEISATIQRLQREIVTAQSRLEAEKNKNEQEVDSLDSFMKELKEAKPTKQVINKLKSDLVKLKQEHGQVIKLVNLTKPAALPPLVADYSLESDKDTKDSKRPSLPIFGKRKKIKVQIPSKNAESVAVVKEDIEDAEEEEEGEVNIKMEENQNEEVKQEHRPSSRLESIDKSEDLLELPKKENEERKKRQNQRRIQQKQKRAEIHKQKGYDEDAAKEDYNMWVPPTDQTGDGRTSLNEKFGY